MPFYELAPFLDGVDPIISVDVPRRPSGQEINVWAFTTCKTADTDQELVLPIRAAGTLVDFTYGAFAMPLVSPLFAETIGETVTDECQLVPAKLDDGRKVFILNVLTSVECFDRKRSQFSTVVDNIDRATGEFVAPYEKIGMVIKLMIDEEKAGAHQIFRISGWSVPIIISGNLAKRLTAAGLTGFSLKEVS